MAFTARPQLRCSWGWVPTLRSISSTSPVSSMMPATMPRWSISCTSIRGASAVLSMLHKIPHPPSVPAECGLSGLGLDMLIQGAISAVGLSLLGVPNALLLGTWVSLTAIIPYLGAWLGAIPAVVVALTVSPTTALLTAILYLVIQQLEGNLLQPKIQGMALNVPDLRGGARLPRSLSPLPLYAPCRSAGRGARSRRRLRPAHGAGGPRTVGAGGRAGQGAGATPGTARRPSPRTGRWRPALLRGGGLPLVGLRGRQDAHRSPGCRVRGHGDPARVEALRALGIVGTCPRGRGDRCYRPDADRTTGDSVARGMGGPRRGLRRRVEVAAPARRPL